MSLHLGPVRLPVGMGRVRGRTSSRLPEEEKTLKLPPRVVKDTCLMACWY